MKAEFTLKGHKIKMSLDGENITFDNQHLASDTCVAELINHYTNNCVDVYEEKFAGIQQHGNAEAFYSILFNAFSIASYEAQKNLMIVWKKS